MSAPFDDLGADDDEALAATRAGVLSSIRDTLTVEFRTSFLIAAAFGAAAALVASLIPVSRHVLRNPAATGVAVALVVLVVLLIFGQLAAGARDYGERDYMEPCDAPDDPFPQGSGIDGTLQRIALSAMNGAACELGTSREELLLSLEPKSGFGPEVTWTQDTLETALRAGLVRAIDDADERDTLPGFAATALRWVAEHTPIDWVLGRFDIPFLED